MPKIPKLIGTIVKTAWSRMFITVTVTEKEQLTNELLRIRFTGDLSNAKYEVGQTVLMQISDTEYRNYTPSTFNVAEGYFDVIFHQKSKGPATAYFKQLTIGAKLTTSLPRGLNVYDENTYYHFFYGDDTCIGFCKALQEMMKKNNHKLEGLLEIDKDALLYANEHLPYMEYIQKSEDREMYPAVDYLESIDTYRWNKLIHGQFYLMGNGKSIQKFRKALRAKGVSANNIITQPFWIQGKMGL
ncbi:oxidoreductase [Myroides marinus]|uniref:NADPH-dependent ferric siderophore reductase, contains FAD-binding and SIP domains n=1 Tax=Myroides marinus TaxID=703342 RepID=A0A1H6X4P3_9FLAO|nr:FAD-binding oxidoreductase [Myroides marinus]MDM1502918.1 oxidoreductase [Myroides marinus]SEJ21547.1 NADPH-dependent ferric siderophore reductase, contains FAD-binding and SIP domains [Myroides marinus]